jgi:rhodanese-related sulfurtransferase
MHQIQPAQLANWLEAAQADSGQAAQADAGPDVPAADGDIGFHAPGAHEHTPVGVRHAPVKTPLLLDVREDWEVQIGRIPGSLHIPMQKIPVRLHELVDADRPIVCYCHHGMRSMQVAMFLEHRGAREVYNLVGGIDAWARLVDPACARY